MGILVAYVLGILTALKPEYHYGDGDHASTDSHKQHNAIDGPITVICTPPTKSNEEEAEKEKKDRRKTIKFRVEMFSAIVLFVYAALTAIIASYSIRAANAAKKSADAATVEANTAQTQLEISERPWISVNLSIDQSAQFQPNGDIGIQLIATMKNIGHSVAKNVRLVPRSDPEGNSFWFTEIPKAQKETCEAWRNFAIPSDHGDFAALFPGDTVVEPFFFVVKKEQIDKVRFELGGKQVITGIALFGCVDYQFPFASKHHQTAFSYDLIKPPPPPAPHVRKFNEAVGGALYWTIGEDIPASRLEIRRSLFGSFEVD